MKQLALTLTILLVAFLLGACVPLPAAPPAPVASPFAGPVATRTAAAWQTFTNTEAGFSIMAPPTWSQQTLPNQSGGAIHGMAFTGPEGGVEVYWGVGFGGACMTGTVQVQLAAGGAPACHATNTDGAEMWSQIGYQVSGGNSFSVRAYTGLMKAQPSSHDLVLQVLSTLTFTAPAQPQAGATTPALRAGASVANPASENCIKQGGTLEIRKEAKGEVGYCRFADDSECEEWALMRGECKPGKAAQFTDPFAYCAAAGTLDAPDSRYAGPKTPDAIVKGVRKALGTADDVPLQPFVDGTTWRCTNGKVMACFVGANLPCEVKADTNKTPNSGIVDYCKSNPTAEVVPAAAAGRATVYEWRCKAGVPEIVKQVTKPDAQGFIDGIWYPIPAPRAPTSAATSAITSTLTLTATAVAPDTLRRAAMLRPMDMSKSSLLGGLAGWEQAVLDKLIQAARYMDAAFWQQVDPEGDLIFKGLTGATTDLEKATRLMLDANYGRWDRFQDFAPFLGNTPRPAGGYVYPPDLTQKELDAYLAAHPDEKERLLDPYTVVRRAGDRLVAVPYHEAYAAYVQPAAALLDEAAELSRNASLANYLRLEAEALRTDDYFAANMAWLDLDSNLDVSIGPHEVYDDQLAGQKAFYKANVLVVDRPAGGRLAQFMSTVPTLQANLPVPAAFLPSQAGTMTPLELADDIYRSGQVRAIMEGVAFSLPNDPKVWEAKGAKKVMMRNYLEARRTLVLTPLLNAIADKQIAQQMDPDTYFNWVLLHEVAHTLGPRTVRKDGKEVTVGQALGQYYSPIEEGKADISGLYSVPYLREQGIITGTLASHYAGYLAESLRSIRFGFGSAYGMIRSAAWNYFVERGAVHYDAATSRFSLDETRMTAAVKELATTLITIEGNGDTAAAAAFFAKYMPVKPELQKLLDKAGETVPIEFVPTYTKTADTAAAQPAAIGKTPLKDALPTLDPQAVWRNFYDLTQIPRPSHHEEKVRDFLVQFGHGLGLETIVDAVGNVLIRKPAAKGMENREGVILQAHMDMVPQKTPESTHDFLTDPIEAYVDGEWVVADGTTLGADDGSGVAIAMAVLQSQTLSHGPIEALFTVNEEDGNDGALGLQGGVLQGSIVINLDSETEGEFTIGSAGGAYANIETTYAESAVPAGMAAYQVSVGGLKGGHSGVDINRGRGHASKLLVRLLKEAAGKYGVRVAQIASGTAANAIPRDASALVVVPTAQTDAFLKGVREFQGIVKSELAATEPGLSVQAAPTRDSVPAKVMDEKAQRTLIDALYGTPQGVMRMSDAVPGLVETSTNMGIVNIGDGQVAVTCFLRSSVDSELADLGQMIASVWDLAGVDVVIPVAYAAWSPDPNSPILLLMQDVYREMYGKDPKVTAVHAGLECGTIVAKYPGMDAISIGPTLQDVHTPDEKMEIATVKKLNDFLLETLKRVPER